MLYMLPMHNQEIALFGHYKEICVSPFNVQPRLSLKRTSHAAEDFAPTSKTGVDYGQLVCGLDRPTVYRLILDSSITPKLENAAAPTASFIQAAWSPRGMLFYQRCLLATLTNLGAVSIKYSFNNSWEVLTDLSQFWVSYCQNLWNSAKSVRCMQTKELVQTLKERASLLKTTCIAWSKVFGEEEDMHCFFAMAQKDGTVIIWRMVSAIGQRRPYAPPVILLTWNTLMENIQSLKWVSTDDHSAWLVVGDVSGIVRMWHIDFVNPAVVNIQNPLGLWLEKDLMRVLSIVECEPPDPASDTEILLVFPKTNFIVGALIDVADSENVVIQTSVKRIAEGEIRGLQPMGNGSLVVATEKVHFALVTYNRRDVSTLDCSISTIPSNLNSTYMSCQGLASSKNNIIWVAQLRANKMYDHLVLRHPTLTTFFKMTPTDALSPLLDNPTGSLSNCWDCLESIRLGHLTGEPATPPMDVSEMELEQLSDYQLRMALWLCTMSDLRQSDTADVERQLRNVISQRIRTLLFARHACARMHTTLSKAASGTELTELDVMSIFLLRSWVLELRRVCTGNSAAAAANALVWPAVADAADKILVGSNGLEDLINETCNVCGEKATKTKELTWNSGGSLCVRKDIRMVGAAPHWFNFRYHTMSAVFVDLWFTTILVMTGNFVNKKTLDTLVASVTFPTISAFEISQIAENLATIESIPRLGIISSFLILFIVSFMFQCQLQNHFAFIAMACYERTKE